MGTILESAPPVKDLNEVRATAMRQKADAEMIIALCDALQEAANQIQKMKTEANPAERKT